MEYRREMGRDEGERARKEEREIGKGGSRKERKYGYCLSSN